MLVTHQPVLKKFWYPVMPMSHLETGPKPFTLLGYASYYGKTRTERRRRSLIDVAIVPQSSRKAGLAMAMWSVPITAGLTTGLELVPAYRRWAILLIPMVSQWQHTNVRQSTTMLGFVWTNRLRIRTPQLSGYWLLSRPYHLRNSFLDCGE